MKKINKLANITICHLFIVKAKDIPIMNKLSKMLYYAFRADKSLIAGARILSVKIISLQQPIILTGF